MLLIALFSIKSGVVSKYAIYSKGIVPFFNLLITSLLRKTYLSISLNILVFPLKSTSFWVKKYYRFTKNAPPFHQKRTSISSKTYLRFTKNVPPFYEKAIYELV